MEIKERAGYFLLKTKETKVGLVYSNKPKVTDELDLVINADLKNTYSLTEPGEYEIKDVFVIVMKKEKGSVYIINVDDINLLLVDAEIDLNEADLDAIGEIDILIFNDGVAVSSDTAKFVNRIDPQVLLIGGNLAGKKEELVKTFGEHYVEEPKKYKVSAADFDNEEYNLQLVQIINGK